MGSAEGCPGKRVSGEHAAGPTGGAGWGDAREPAVLHLLRVGWSPRPVGSPPAARRGVARLGSARRSLSLPPAGRAGGLRGGGSRPAPASRPEPAPCGDKRRPSERRPQDQPPGQRDSGQGRFNPGRGKSGGIKCPLVPRPPGRGLNSRAAHPKGSWAPTAGCPGGFPYCCPLQRSLGGGSSNPRTVGMFFRDRGPPGL